MLPLVVQYPNKRSVDIIDHSHDEFIVANTNVMTTLYSFPIAGGMLDDTRLQFELDGTFFNNTGIGQSYTIQILYGGVVIFQDQTAVFVSNVNIHQWRLDLRFYRINHAAASLRLSGEHWLSGLPATVGTGNLADLNTVLSWALGGSSVVNSNLDQTFEIKVQLSAISPNLLISRECLQVFLIP